MRKVIQATDGRTALLRQGEIAVIGYVYDFGYRMAANGELEPCTMVVMDFEGTEKNKDYWFFENDGLIYHHLSASPDKEVRKLYEEIMRAKKCSLNNFLVTVTSGYAAAMVYGPKTP